MQRKSELTVPRGFSFSAVEANIRKTGRKDLALVVSETEAVMSGVFTTNKVKAAPVKVDMMRIRSGNGRAIVVNSGNANACTGERGTRDALDICGMVASPLGANAKQVYICSTGVIGTPLPMERITQKIPELIGGIGKSSLHDVAEAIMTTDTFPKIAGRILDIDKRKISIAGVCKGAGMIAPHMATMLCFLMTDALIERKALDSALRHAVDDSFNKITVDGDRSTNDTVLVMANGMAGNRIICEGSRTFRNFTLRLSEVTEELSRLIVKDGEGATKLIEIVVKNAKSRGDAEKAAFTIADSLLVKTALYGSDANWGRIMAAIGYSGIVFQEERCDISICNVKVCRKGITTGREIEAAVMLKAREVGIVVDLHIGNASAKVLSCDLTEEYVRINAEYRT
jgi:glutamate N-acetyltransferase / amino-acid N-acetyltransferase